ncbi:MAG: DMT family transporter [Geminicoccaceae bacterium]
MGIALYALGMFFMSTMDVSAKWLSGDYPVVQVVFLASLFALLPALLVLRNEGARTLLSPKWMYLILRSVIATGTIFFFFFALKHLPLAEVAAIFAVAPLLMTAMAALLLREDVGLRRWMATMLGLLGATIIIRPGSLAFDPASLLALGSAFCYALAMILSKMMVRIESNAAIMFYNYVTVNIISGAMLLFTWTMPNGKDTLIFVSMGIFGGCANYFCISACRSSPIQALAPFDYTALIWAILFGYLFWQHVPDLWTWVGAVAVTMGGIYVLSGNASPNNDREAMSPHTDQLAQPRRQKE